MSFFIMSDDHNYLQIYRKRSSLTQPDVAFLMEHQDHSKLSRYEKGQRTPSIEMLLAYHLLFDVPIEAFFERQKQELHLRILRRIHDLRNELKARDNIPKAEIKIEFLEGAINRLSR